MNVSLIFIMGGQLRDSQLLNNYDDNDHNDNNHDSDDNHDDQRVSEDDGDVDKTGNGGECFPLAAPLNGQCLADNDDDGGDQDGEDNLNSSLWSMSSHLSHLQLKAT